MNGMKKRITVGFMGIVALLFVSGLISFLELSHLSNDTEDIIKAGTRNLHITKKMFDAAQEQNNAMIRFAVVGDVSEAADASCRESMAHLDDAFLTATADFKDNPAVDSLAETISAINGEVNNMLTFGIDDEGRITDTAWYDSRYVPLYTTLTQQIEGFMNTVQDALTPRAGQLKKNAYRAVMPVLLCSIVMIVVVLMFYYFMVIYSVNPIRAMNKSLGDYLSFHLPFNVKAECRDEVLELKEKIESLISLVKPSK